MSKERELLERAYYVLGELSYAMLKDSGEYNLAGDIYEFLSTPEPTQDEEPVAWRVRQSVNHEWLTVGIEESASHCKESGWIVEPLYLHPAPRPEFVRLSEEEVREIEASIPPKMDLAEAKKKFARAIEDALEEKNK